MSISDQLLDSKTYQRGKIMDIEQLTIKQVKELQSLFTNTQNTSRLGYPIGQYVIIHSINEGLNAGVLVQADETGCVLREARRLWRPVSKDRMSWYEGVSISGLDEDSRVSAPVIQKIIVEAYSITTCSAAAEQSIREFATNETRR